MEAGAAVQNAPWAVPEAEFVVSVEHPTGEIVAASFARDEAAGAAWTVEVPMLPGAAEAASVGVASAVCRHRDAAAVASFGAVPPESAALPVVSEAGTRRTCVSRGNTCG